MPFPFSIAPNLPVQKEKEKHFVVGVVIASCICNSCILYTEKK